jgi:hypothetical protein
VSGQEDAPFAESWKLKRPTAAGEEGFLHEIFTFPVLLRTPKATILVRSGDVFNEFFKAKIVDYRSIALSSGD